MRSILAALALALFLAIAADKADAQETARHPNGDTVTITDNACAEAAVLAIVPPHLHQHLRAGHAVVGGTHYEMCWISQGTAARLIFADGDTGLVPWSEFEKVNKRGT